MDPLVRAIDDRGLASQPKRLLKQTAAEGVPPPSEGVPRPPTPAPPPVPGPAPNSVPTQVRAPQQQVAGGGTHGITMSFADITAFVAEQQTLALERDALVRAEMKAQQAEMALKLSAMEAKLAPAVAISDEELTKLQTRLETLHGKKLLSDEELAAIEDLCADIIELESSTGKLLVEMAQANPVVAKVCKLTALSSKLLSDTAFARQLKRKFI